MERSPPLAPLDPNGTKKISNMLIKSLFRAVATTHHSSPHLLRDFLVPFAPLPLETFLATPLGNTV